MPAVGVYGIAVGYKIAVQTVGNVDSAVTADKNRLKADKFFVLEFQSLSRPHYKKRGRKSVCIKTVVTDDRSAA